MPYRFCSAILLFLTASVGPLQGVTPGRLFVLKGMSEIVQFRKESGDWKRMNSYSDTDFPQIFPVVSMEMKSGNILCVYDRERTLRGRLRYDPAADVLQKYEGHPGDPKDRGGRILESPVLGEQFRKESGLYKDLGFYQAGLTRDEFRKAVGNRYRDIFLLEGRVFGIKGDRIDRLSRDSSTGAVSSKKALVLPGSTLTHAAVSPWQEAFLSDSALKAVQRVHLFGGSLKSSGSITGNDLESPGSLEFGKGGELFVANTRGGAHDLIHFEFVLRNFTQWNARKTGSIDLRGSKEATALTLARPVGFVLSEKTHPPVRIGQEKAGGHHGISQSLFVHPIVNSEEAVVALVEYGPGGHTPVHYHEKMEQIQVVVSGRALWELGESEVEVAAGDVIFCPQWVKHGYKVLGDEPFKFLQLEWPGE